MRSWLLVGMLWAAAVADAAPGVAYEELIQDGVRWRFDAANRGTARFLAGPGGRRLDDLRRAYGVPPARGLVTITIAKDLQTFRDLLGGDPPHWYAAAARGSAREIYLRSQQDLATESRQALGTLAHELSHVVLAEAAGPAAHTIPRWFDEGLAQYASGEKTWEYLFDMGANTLLNAFLPFESIEEGFPESAGGARVAYEQSYSAVSFLIRRYGFDGISALLAEMRAGKTFPSAFRAAYAWSLRRFEEEWREDTRMSYGLGAVVAGAGSIWTLATLLFIVAYLRKRRRARNRLIIMEAEDELQDAGVPPTVH